MDPPNSSFKKQLLLDLRDTVKYWKRATGVAEQSLEDARMETARLLEGATRENQGLQLQLEAQQGRIKDCSLSWKALSGTMKTEGPCLLQPGEMWPLCKLNCSWELNLELS